MNPVRLGIRLLDPLLGYEGQWLRQYDALGYVPNLVRPRSFNEKLMRRQLAPHPPAWAVLADKVRVRDYVRDVVGPGYLNEIYLITDDPDELRLAELPECFVLKANHGCGWNLLVPDKGRADEAALRAQCRAWLGMRFGADTYERWYEDIPPRIIVERFLENRDRGIPPEYKVWVFHGAAHFVRAHVGRFGNFRTATYDRDWRRLPWTKEGEPAPDLPRPGRLGEVLEVAEQLAGDLDYVRVDLYCVDDEAVVFGEVTLAPGAGCGRFRPDKRYDFEVGALW